uniref:Uncharacterized protein n=1 Tax=Spodoptera exigua multiple nucleopolyhedrovirus TaxID=10454 RepID=A0A6N0CB07_9ABAC|nr:hypothetical protein [Spodoptera exigua multiple nucleopolyhedrovirus]
MICLQRCRAGRLKQIMFEQLDGARRDVNI